MQKALVIGASRGIGKKIATTFAKAGYGVGVASRTVEDTTKSPGTIFTTTKEITDSGFQALPIKCNVRSTEDIENAVNICISHFGSLDVVVYNAGAITWDLVVDTPMEKFDLLMDVNVRGAYALTQTVLPYFLKKRFGKIILVSPPLYSRFFKGKTPYAISKHGMTILVQGLSHELIGSGVSITALWPAAPIRSHVTEVLGIQPKLMREPDIFADACLAIANEKSDRLNGKCLIDEDYLRSIQIVDFKKYRCDPEFEPPRMMPKKFPSLLVEGEDEPLQN